MAKKVRILRILSRFNIGGPTHNVLYLSKYLAPDFETLLIGGLHEKNEESSTYMLENEGVNFLLLKNMKRKINLIKDFKSYLEVKKIIHSFQPDIVHTHTSKAGLIGRLAAISCNIPIIIHTFHGHIFHSYFSGIKTFIFKLLERFLAKRSTAIIAISKEQKKELCSLHKIVDENKIKVIKLGFKLSKFRINQEEKKNLFRNRYSIPKDTLLIGIVGRLSPIKNHKLFIDSIIKVIEKKRDVIAIIVGDGKEKEKLTSYINKKKVSSHFIFTSWVKAIDEVMAGLDIVALTSFNEGTPVSLIEASAASKPIVTTSVGGIKSIVEDTKTGFVVNNFSTEKFANELIKLISSKSLRKDMGKKGSKKVFLDYDYNILINNTKDLYLKMLNKL